MDKLNLIVNTGSASRKYALYSGDRQLVFAHLEYDNKKPVCTFYSHNHQEKISITEKDFVNSLQFSLDNFIKKNFILSIKDIKKVAIRIVAPGEFFREHKKIDKQYEKELKIAKGKAPLHLAPIFDELKRIKKIFRDIDIIGISDSAFHSTIPDYVKYYAIDKKVSDKIGLHRFGYHGISIKSIISKLQDKYGALPSRIIVCHIGGGVSITAVKDCKSIDTSMGFTPLEGTAMATRVGDIDPGALLYLIRRSGVRYNKILTFLNKGCGLLGISGQSSDVRDLLAIEDKDQNAKLALDMYAYRIAKYIASYSAPLSGIDMLVFSGTVGERSFIMRNRICEKLLHLGIVIDRMKNDASEGIDADITAGNSQVKVLVVKTDEMQQMAKEIQPF